MYVIYDPATKGIYDFNPAKKIPKDGVKMLKEHCDKLIDEQAIGKQLHYTKDKGLHTVFPHEISSLDNLKEKVNEALKYLLRDITELTSQAIFLYGGSSIEVNSIISDLREEYLLIKQGREGMSKNQLLTYSARTTEIESLMLKLSKLLF